MESLLIDTNVILRFLLLDVPQQVKEIKVFFNKAKANKIKIIVPEVVIFEAKYALGSYYKFTNSEVSDRLEALVSASFFEVENKTIFLKAISYFRGSNLSFVDCFLVAKSEIEKVEIFTFDKDLKKFASQVAS